MANRHCRNHRVLTRAFVARKRLVIGRGWPRSLRGAVIQGAHPPNRETARKTSLWFALA